MRRTLRTLILLTLPIGAAPRAAPAAPPVAADSLWTADERDSLEHVRGLLAGRAYAAADASARRLLSSVTARAGESALPVALVLDPLVTALVNEGRAATSEAKDFAERALRIERSRLAPDDPALATGLMGLANVLFLRGEYAAARPPYEQALSIREQRLGPDDLDLANSRNLLGVLLVREGDPGAAMPLLELALGARTRRLGAEDTTVAESHNNLAFALKERGDYAAARAHYESALSIWTRRRGARSPEAAIALDNIAGLLERTGDFANARRFYEEARTIREATTGPASLDVARTLSNLGNLLTETGDFDAARRMLERARTIREAALPPGHPDLAASLANLGELALASGDRAAARRLFEQALAGQERSLGPDHPDVARTLRRLAELRRTDGDLPGAIALDTRAITILETRRGPAHPEVAAALNDLAVVHVMTGEFARARSEYESAMKILARTLGPHHPELAKNLERFAELLLAQGQGREAVGLALRAEAVGRENFRATMGDLTEREALAFAQVRSSGLDVALSVLDSLPDPATRRSVLDAVVHARALVLDEIAARHRSLRAPGNAMLDSLVTSLQATATRYMNLLERGPDPAHPERYLPMLERAQRERETVERALSPASGVFRRQQRVKEIGLDDVAASLAPGSALVAYVAYGKLGPGPGGGAAPAYLSYVVRGGIDGAAVVPLGRAARVDSLIRRWRQEAVAGVRRPLRQQSAAYEPAGRALRQAIWDPIALHLAGIDRVFVVPDGAINLVSFATLPLDDGSYLVEHGPLLHYVSAERDLVPLDSSAVAGRGILLVGGPNFDARPGTRAPGAAIAGPLAATFRGARSSCGDFAAVRFGPLPGTLVEVKDLARLWQEGGATSAGGTRASGPVVALTGAAASERAFKLDAPGNAVLHIATHGFFFTGHCRSSIAGTTRGIEGVEPAGGERPHRARAPRTPGPPSRTPIPAVDAPESPLVLSGLALTGANLRASAPEGEEDGILTAEEIAALDLAGCDWAVLSACDTGVGEIRAGEGVFGLRRAFAVAGAKTLIMSLWPIDDRSTSAWMRRLYQARFRDRLTTAEAVRVASLEALRTRRLRGLSTHPFYWGGFVAAGDWR